MISLRVKNLQMILLSGFSLFILGASHFDNKNLGGNFLLRATTESSYSALLSLKKNQKFDAKELAEIENLRSVKSVRSVFSNSEAQYLEQIQASHLAKAWVVEFKSESDFLKAQGQLQTQNSALRLEPNDLGIQITDDAYENLQWGLHNTGQDQSLDLDLVKSYRVPGLAGEDIHMSGSQKPISTGQKVIVAVLDTGTDHSHPDLKANLIRKESECKALEKMLKCAEDQERSECEKTWMDLKNPEVDQDKNGYPLDCSGWSLLGGKNAANIMGRPDFEDDQGHGTHVAGIISAEAGNQIGVRGVSSRVQILPVQVIGVGPSEPLKPQSVRPMSVKDLIPKSLMDPSESVQKPQANRSLGDLVARGVIYAIRSGAKVLNFSLGWPQARDSEYMRSIIAEAQKRGAIIVAAAGNDSTRALLRPCAYDGVICVAAHGPDGSLAHFSNFGSGVDIAAPGINILSTYPMDMDLSRFRNSQGYEYLSGTSQASPFVAGVVADLLARGIPANEIYPRLVLGARPSKLNQALIEGLPHQVGSVLVANAKLEKKFILSGLMDVQKSLSVGAQELILPANKEVHVISWDRQSTVLKTEFQLKNFWKDVKASNVHVKAFFAKSHAEAIRPIVQSVSVSSGSGAVWKNGEVRNVTVVMKIQDQVKASESQIPSELNLNVDIISPSGSRSVVVENEVLVEITKNSPWNDVRKMPIKGLTSSMNDSSIRSEFMPVDENWDSKPEKRDYFLIQYEVTQPKKWTLQLVQQDTANSYVVSGSAKVNLPGDVDSTRPQIMARYSDQGQVRYVLGLLQDKSDEETPTPSPMNFYIFDQQMKLVDSYEYDSSKAQIPFQVYWMDNQGQKTAAWIGFGKDPERSTTLRDRWENPQNNEKSQLRFYFINENKELKALQKFNDFKIIDIVEPTQGQKDQGIVPVLLAKNRGTEAKPSYLYDFARAEVVHGQVQNFQVLNFFSERKTYRNILDTRVDKVLNLDRSKEPFAGTFWFSEGAVRQQRVSMYDPMSNQFLDQEVKALNRLYDSALWVRAAFKGAKSAGAFVLTNSEIQYHDLTTGQISSRSFERYTFFPDSFMTNAYFPVTIADKDTSKSHRAALFTTETSGLSRGVKMVVPVFAMDGSVIELVSPARLRIKSNAGCRPLNTPVFLGPQGYAFDYYCGDQILRVPLKM